MTFGLQKIALNPWVLSIKNENGNSLGRTRVKIFRCAINWIQLIQFLYFYHNKGHITMIFNNCGKMLSSERTFHKIIEILPTIKALLVLIGKKDKFTWVLEFLVSYNKLNYIFPLYWCWNQKYKTLLKFFYLYY